MKQLLNSSLFWMRAHFALFITIVILLASTSAVAYFWYPPLWTYFIVTDPKDPRFDPTNFRFEYYRSHKELAEFMRTHFPVGTPKTYVDQVLVGSGGAHIRAQGPFSERSQFSALGHGYDKADRLKHFTAHSYAIYRKGTDNKLFSWVVTVYYDEHMNVKLIIAQNEIVHEQGSASVGGR